MIRLAGEIALFISAMFVAMFVLCLPLAWFDGTAKSAFLKQTQGIDIPWYQATWLNVQTNQVNLRKDQQP